MKTRLAPTLTLLVAAAGLVYALEPREPQPLAAPLSSAPAEANTVTVSATGKASAAESYLQMSTSIKGNAEVAEEAVANFVQARARTMSGLEASELEGLEVVAAGLEMDFMAEVKNDPNMGFVVASRDGGEPPEAGVTCTEELEVRFAAASDPEAQRAQIAQAIDVAVDLGLKLKTKNNTNPYYYNPNDQTNKEGTIDGRLTDEDMAKVEREAQASAMARARELAGNLAELSGRKLGSVNSIVLKTMTASWKGVGQGVEATATLTVSFNMVD